MSPSGLLTLVTGASGVIVRARGGDAFSDEVRKTRLVEGARWDEGARGTNAIGTAIVEAQPIAVVGRAHFEAVNHGLFCYAAPVLDPFGEVVAVLDVTGPLSLEAAHAEAEGLGMRGLVISLARQLNKLLGRRGKVWGDRWHGRELGSPSEVRSALVYVFRNSRVTARGRSAAASSTHSPPHRASPAGRVP